VLRITEPADKLRWSTSRVEAFSDGVFAIAITLLVLEIQIPLEDYDHLWRAIGKEWPSYFAYVTSFLVVGGVWLAHHRLFSHLRFIDPHLMRLNILLLMVAAFLPFPTGLLAEAFDVSRDAERAAVVVYGVTAGLIELLLGAAWRYAATQPSLLHGDAPPPRGALQRHGFPALVYGGGIVVSVLLFPRLGAVLYLLVAARAVLTPAGELRLTLGR
jgi:TMEM175 potassium channel family protein